MLPERSDRSRTTSIGIRRTCCRLLSSQWQYGRMHSCCSRLPHAPLSQFQLLWLCPVPPRRPPGPCLRTRQVTAGSMPPLKRRHRRVFSSSYPWSLSFSFRPHRHFAAAPLGNDRTCSTEHPHLHPQPVVLPAGAAAPHPAGAARWVIFPSSARTASATSLAAALRSASGTSSMSKFSL